jgi:hypothetical protein
VARAGEELDGLHALGVARVPVHDALGHVALVVPAVGAHALQTETQREV